MRLFAAFCGVQTPFSAKSRPAPGAAQQPWVAVFLLYTHLSVILNLFLKEISKIFSQGLAGRHNVPRLIMIAPGQVVE
jgi:hypothetical protein